MKKHKFYEDLGFAKVDYHRHLRKGFPEVIYCEGKTPQQVAKIALQIAGKGHAVLATRADKIAYLAIKKILPNTKYYKTARIVVVSRKSLVVGRKSLVAVITAGTSDIPVAEEAAVTAEFLGLKVVRLYDVGVAGIHRLLHNLHKIEKSKVLIVVAGMEGALPSVVGGLTDKPIIAVPTSVGYGSSFKGLAALLTMMNSCAPGVAVVNIDNGFGAAVMAYSIIKQL
ncbi:MAG: nickel pincer cofactor biosynthesis protein LarB [Candidatus Margulisbacteria bacterium]|nr:nickel pincer cofactor biosynthesis protein LarB [Candidatus Margulisiibacteriota bacterium]